VPDSLRAGSDLYNGLLFDHFVDLLHDLLPLVPWKSLQKVAMFDEEISNFFLRISLAYLV
jgi:hypothetical protein